MVFGWQKSQRSRRAVIAPPTIPSAIAEDGCEIVPQFFPGYKPRMPIMAAAAPASAFEKPQHAREGTRPQRRAGSVRVAITSDTAPTNARLSDRHQQRSASVYQSPLEARRASSALTAPSASAMSHQYEAMPRSSSCNYPASRNVQKSPQSFDNVEPMSPNVRRASAITVVQYQPSTPSTAVDYSTTPVSDEMQPGSYFHRRRGSTASHGVSRSNSGSSTSTAAPSPTLRSTLPKHVNSLFHHAHRRLRMPLRRNHTTKTVSHNDLMSDDSGQHYERALRSSSFAEMPAYQQSIPMHPTSMRFSTDMPSPKSPAYAGSGIADASAPTTLVESVRVDLDGNGDVRIATRLVPRVHNSAGAQMAYLPPRTSALTVTNAHL